MIVYHKKTGVAYTNDIWGNDPIAGSEDWFAPINKAEAFRLAFDSWQRTNDYAAFDLLQRIAILIPKEKIDCDTEQSAKAEYRIIRRVSSAA